jgi:predicted RNase H-related nuclease YkuK (DUF458 family)
LQDDLNFLGGDGMSDTKNQDRVAKISELEKRIIKNYRDALEKSLKDSEDIPQEKETVFHLDKKNKQDK